MPVASPNSSLIYSALKECDIRLLSALPETWLVSTASGAICPTRTARKRLQPRARVPALERLPHTRWRQVVDGRSARTGARGVFESELEFEKDPLVCFFLIRATHIVSSRGRWP